MIPIIPTVFSGFDITLKKIVAADLPLLYEKRNSHDLMQYMADKREVTLPVLEFWLKKAEIYGTTFPFFAYYNDEPIAYLELKDCNYQDGICEDGIFLFNNPNLGKGFGSRIYLCREKLLLSLNLCNVISNIHQDNKRSINFFKKLGADFLYIKNGFLVYRQEYRRRIKALEQIAQDLNLLEEFNKHYAYRVDYNQLNYMK